MVRRLRTSTAANLLIMTKSWQQLAEMLRPPLELPRLEKGDTDMTLQGMPEENESKFSKLQGKLSRQKGVKNPRALAAAIGIKKYGAKGMAARRGH